MATRTLTRRLSSARAARVVLLDEMERLEGRVAFYRRFGKAPAYRRLRAIQQRMLDIEEDILRLDRRIFWVETHSRADEFELVPLSDDNTMTR